MIFRVPVFEQRIDNIVGIAYAMDLLDYVQKVYYLQPQLVVFPNSSGIISNCTHKSHSMQNYILFGFEGRLAGKFCRGRHGS